MNECERKSNINKLLITGTGRAGTTFLMRIFTLLEFNTGYDLKKLNDYIDINCKAGMERKLDAFNNVDVIKSPWLYDKINIISKSFNYLEVLVPVRDSIEAGKSRINNGYGDGGLWYATNLNEQVDFYHKVIDTINNDCTKNDIKLIYIEFDKFTTDIEYCYDALQQLTIFNKKKIEYNKFLSAYRQAELIYK